jgi:hypothetical protein
MLLPPSPDQIIQQDFSVKDAPEVDKNLQLSAQQDFTIDGTKERLKEKKRMTPEHHNETMKMGIHIEGKPEVIDEIASAITQED